MMVKTSVEKKSDVICLKIKPSRNFKTLRIDFIYRKKKIIIKIANAFLESYNFSIIILQN